jgi:hypothetical protein
MTFYQTDRRSGLRDTVFHEAVHCLYFKYPEEGKIFRSAAYLERDGYFVRPYARMNWEENAAVHGGEWWMDRSSYGFVAIAEQTPLRSLAIGRLVERAVLDNPEPQDIDPTWLKRVQYLRDKFLPGEVATLQRLQSSSKPRTAQAAQRLLDALNSRIERFDGAVDPFQLRYADE